jgi:hypothetical protein
MWLDMAKKTKAAPRVEFHASFEGPDAEWARNVQRIAEEQGKAMDQVLRDALHDWLWHASGLKRMFEQIREAGDLMTRSFQVEGMLVGLARSAGMSLGQQSDYVKRAQDERALYEEQRKSINRLVRDIRRVAAETGLADAIAAAEKLIVPE